MSDLFPSLITTNGFVPYNGIVLTGKVAKIQIEPFACGGFSDVFRGKVDGRTHPVAIKVLREKLNDEDAGKKIVKRFFRESGLWDTLDHPNILPFLGVSLGFGRFPALVSPLCESGNAVAYLRKHPEANRLEIIIGTAKGLAYLHSKDIIHGDFKGHNVLIDDKGNPCISDFGRSLILKHEGFITDLTGSAPYMAPELFGPVPDSNSGSHIQNGVKDFVPQLTKASDVYAFDMVILELLTCQAPWYWLRPERVILVVSAGQRPGRERYDSTAISDAHWQLLEDCWVGEPTNRPTMTTIIQRLTPPTIL